MSLVASAHQRMMKKKKMEKKLLEKTQVQGGVGGVKVIPTSPAKTAPSSSASDSSPASVIPVISPDMSLCAPLIFDDSRVTETPTPIIQPTVAMLNAAPPKTIDDVRSPQNHQSSSVSTYSPREWAPDGGAGGGGSSAAASLVTGGKNGMNSINSFQPYYEQSPRVSPRSGGSGPSQHHAPQQAVPSPTAQWGESSTPLHYPQQQQSPMNYGGSPTHQSGQRSTPPAYFNYDPGSDYEQATRPRGRHTNYLPPRVETSGSGSPLARVPNRSRRGYDSFVGAPPTSPTPDGQNQNSNHIIPPRLTYTSNHRAVTTAGTGAAISQQDRLMISQQAQSVISPRPQQAQSVISPTFPHVGSSVGVPVLGNKYDHDFEYHTEKDEDSTSANNIMGDKTTSSEEQPSVVFSGGSSTDNDVAERVSTDPSVDSSGEEQRTIASEEAVPGTPVRKKSSSKLLSPLMLNGLNKTNSPLIAAWKQKKNKKKKPTLVILDDKFSSGWENNGGVEPTSGSVAATAGDGVGGDDSSPSTARGFIGATDDSEDPPRIVNNLNSWDTSDNMNKFPTSSSAAIVGAAAVVGGISGAVAVDLFSGSFWENSSFNKEQQPTSDTTQTSMFWDNNDGTTTKQHEFDGIVSGGTWGEHPLNNDTNSLFSNLDNSKTTSDKENVNDIQDLDKVENQWRKGIDNPPPPPLVPPPKTKRGHNHHPWKTDFEKGEVDQISVLTGLENGDVDSDLSNSLQTKPEDDDTIESNRNVETSIPPVLVNPAEIFGKINSCLQQADQNRTYQRSTSVNSGPPPLTSGPPPLTTVDQSEASSVLSSSLLDGQDEKRNSGKRIQFVSDAHGVDAVTVHTFLKDPNEYRCDTQSFDDDSEDDESINYIDNKPQQNRSISPGMNSERSDNDATYNEESTVGDSVVSYKSDEERVAEVDLLDDLRKDVDNAVTVVATAIGLGGFFGIVSPKSNNRTADGGSESDTRGSSAFADNGDDKSTKSGDNETYVSAASTADRKGGTEDNNWLSFMSRIIFPHDMSSSERSTGGTTIDDTFEAGSTYQDGSTYQEEEDNYLQLQAMAAARVIHDKKGMDYDETNEINVLSDITFVVVTVSLPLGCEYYHTFFDLFFILSRFY